MLETIRSIALDELEAAQEVAPLRLAHATWAEAFARDSDKHVLGPESGTWLERYEREHDNFRLAIAWAIENDPDDLGLRVPEAVWRFWEIRGHYAEGRRWLEQALAACQNPPPKRRALARDGLGNIAWRQGDLPAATRAFAESLAIWRETGDRRSISGTLSNLGNVTELQGDLDRARELQEEALAIAREIDEPLRVATILNNLALVVWNKGDTERAATLLEESAVIKRKEGNLVGLATTLNNLGTLADATGDTDRALAYLEETLEIDRKLGNLTGIADSLGNLAGLISPRGETARAAALDAEALEIRRDLGDRVSTAYSFESIAATAARAGFPETGARLFAAAKQLREETGAPLPPTEYARYEQGLAVSRNALSPEAFEREWKTGTGLPLDYAIAEALHIARQIAQSAPATD